MEDNPVFISITGNQAFGTLETYLALIARKGKLPARLLYTAGTQQVADRLRTFIEDKAYGDVELIKVSMGLGNEDSAPQVATRIAEQAEREGRRVCFNLDGGLNYLIVASVLALEKFQPLYIQAARDRVVLTDTRDESHHALRLPAPLSLEEILYLQDVPYEMDVKENPDQCEKLPFAQLLEKEGIRLPAGGWQNARIDNLVFDYIWNPGNNRLSFIKDWRFKPDKDRDRDFVQWSKDRRRCGQIHDKRVYAILNNRISQERLSHSQIDTLLYTPWSWKTAADATAFAEALTKIFSEKPPKVSEKQLKVPDVPACAPMKDETLVVCLGSELYSTLLAICSHRPRHLVVACSKAVPVVREHLERLCAFAGELGVESVTHANFRIEGIYADHVLPTAEPGKPRIAVNISPGTKGQGAMLARWARRNGYEIWTIHQREHQCVPLQAPAGTRPLPNHICDPALLFRLLGRELLSEGLPEQGFAADFEWLDALLAFMRHLDAAGLDINDAFNQSCLKHGQNSLKRIGREWRLRMDGREYFFIRENRGAWFEKLCGRAMMNAGLKHVRLNLKLSWNEENQADIQKLYSDSQQPHKFEFDVLGDFQGQLVMISAKSYDLREDESRKGCLPLAEVIEDARNTSKVMDKFTLSIVTHMGTNKKTTDDRVALLSWRDICYPEKLARQIEALSSIQSTTRQEA